MGDLKLYDRGPQVQRLQELLNAKLSPSPGLELDSDFGDATQAAVVRFQQSQGIRPANGVVDSRTMMALERAVAPPRRVRPWMDIARDQLREQNSSGRRAEYFRAGGVSSGSDWCSAFVNWVMQEGCYVPTYSGLAQSWTQWGQACEPMPGAVVILYDAYFTHPSFPGNPWPHVGFLDHVETAATSVARVGNVPVHLGIGLRMLGGNQGNAVSYMSVPAGPDCSYPPYIAGAAFRWPSLSDLKLIRELRKLVTVFIPQRGRTPASKPASRPAATPPLSSVVLGEEGSFQPYDEGARCLTSRSDYTGIKARLRLSTNAGAGDGDYTYFNFYLGLGAAVEAGISFTVNNPKFADRGGQWRKFLNPGGPSVSIGTPWGREFALQLEIDEAGVASFWVDGSLLASAPTKSRQSKGPVKMVMAVHNEHNQRCWYTPALFSSVQIREADRKTWTAWTGGGSTSQISPRGEAGKSKPSTCMVVTQAFPLGTFLLPKGVRSWGDLETLTRKAGSLLKSFR